MVNFRRAATSLPAFAWNDVSIPVRPITRRHSLSPLSFTRISISVPCGSLARCSGREYGFTVFRTSYTNSVDPAFPPVMFCPCARSTYSSNPSPTFWSKPVSIFGLLKITRFISSSLMLVLLSSLAPRPPDAGSGWNHLAAFPSLTRGFIVPVASDQAVASFACTGRLPLKEQRVSLPLPR